jgi:hypothetical protein
MIQCVHVSKLNIDGKVGKHSRERERIVCLVDVGPSLKYPSAADKLQFKI